MSNRRAVARRLLAEHGAAAGLILALWALLFGPALRTDELFFFRDLLHNYVPMKWLVAQAYRAGELPLWNALQFSGTPFAAEVLTQPYYPANVLFLLPSFELGFNLFVTLHYLWAAFGAYALGRARGLTAAPSALLGVGFGFCLPLVWGSNAVHFLCAQSYFGWILAAYSVWLRDRSPRHLALTALLLSLQLFAGDPQSAFLSCAALTFVALFSEAPWSRKGRDAGWVVGIALAAALSAVIVLVPAYELSKLATRETRITLEAAQWWSFHPVRAIELFLPTPFGNFHPELSYWGDFTITGERRTPYFLSAYAGVVLLGLALFGLARGPRVERRTVLALVAVTALCALGHHAPVYGLLYRVIPFWNLFRYPERMLPLLALFLGWAAAVGLQTLLTTQLSRARVAFGSVMGLSALTVAFSFAGRTLLPDGAHPETLLSSGLHSLGFSAVAFAATYVRAASMPAWLLPGLAAADLLVAGQPLVWLAPSSLFFDRPAGVPIAAGERTFFDTRLNALPHRATAELPLLVAQRVFERDAMKPNFGWVHGVSHLSGYGSAQLLSFAATRKALPGRRMLDVFGVNWISAPASDPGPWRELPVVSSPEGAKVYRNVHAFPKAWLATGVRKVSPDERAAALAAVDLSTTALVDPTAPIEERPPVVGEPGRVSEVHRTANTVRFEVEAAADALLVTSEAFYPGWSARVDGREGTVLEADGHLRSVPVPAGRHEVELRYRPTNLTSSALISGASLLGLIGVAVLSRRRSS